MSVLSAPAATFFYVLSCGPPGVPHASAAMWPTYTHDKHHCTYAHTFTNPKVTHMLLHALEPSTPTPTPTRLHIHTHTHKRVHSHQASLSPYKLPRAMAATWPVGTPLPCNASGKMLKHQIREALLQVLPHVARSRL